MHIAIATITKSDLSASYTRSLAETIESFNKTYQNPKISLLLHEAALVTIGRNLQFWEAKKLNVDGLIFIDSDIAFPENGLSKLINSGKDIITGVYYSRIHPFRPHIYKIAETNMVENLVDFTLSEPFKIGACGAGFLYISRKALDAFEKIDGDEPFDLIKNKVNTWAGEDISFCLRCRDKGLEIWADPSIRLGHIRNDTIWPEHWMTAKKLIREKNGIKRKPTDIPGWMYDNELEWLTKISSKMESVLEVGAWKGRSTAAIASGCKGTVYSIDHFKGSNEELHKQKILKEPSIFGQFATNMTNYDNLVVMKMDSMNAVRLFPDKSIDMIFIDGSHEYQDVKNDIMLWTPKARKIICGHDYCNEWMDVKQAVNESFDNINIEDSIWWTDLTQYK